MAGSCLVKGGNTMEYLMINNNFRINKWRVCDDKLPYSACGHGMNLLENRIILTGGEVNGKLSNEVWQGKISLITKLHVNWFPLPPMMETRHNHVTVVIQEKLFCIGGDNGNGKHSASTEYFSFEANCWQKGPELPFILSGGKAVVNKQQTQCFLLGGYRDGRNSTNISLFDPIKGITNIQGNLDFPRCNHIAVML